MHDNGGRGGDAVSYESYGVDRVYVGGFYTYHKLAHLHLTEYRYRNTHAHLAIPRVTKRNNNN